MAFLPPQNEYKYYKTNEEHFSFLRQLLHWVPIRLMGGSMITCLNSMPYLYVIYIYIFFCAHSGIFMGSFENYICASPKYPILT